MRRIVAHVVVGLVVASFIALGIWQLTRWTDRKAFNAALVARADLPAADAATLAGTDPAAIAYRRAELTGTYDIAREFLLLSRSFDGLSGHHVVTPLLIGDGRAILVDRGWVPLTFDEPPVSEASPPRGTIEARGVLVPSSERGLFSPREIVEGDVLTGVHRIDLDFLREFFPYELAGVFLQLDGQRPAAGELPELVPFPPPDGGPHLGYAVQWFLFAAAASVTYAALLRRRRTRMVDTTRSS